MFYSLCDLFLVLVGRVIRNGLKFVVCQECMCFVVVVLFIYDNYGFSFVCLCDHGIVLFDLVVTVFLLDMLDFLCGVSVVKSVVKLFNFLAVSIQSRLAFLLVNVL